MPRRPDPPKQVALAERREEVLDLLREGGHTIDEIASRVGYVRRTVERDIAWLRSHFPDVPKPRNPAVEKADNYRHLSRTRAGARPPKRCRCEEQACCQMHRRHVTPHTCYIRYVTFTTTQSESARVMGHARAGS